jgi:ribosome-binding factor A
MASPGPGHKVAALDFLINNLGLLDRERGSVMASGRIRRVGELIKEEISDIIQKEMKDPRIGFVTITGVDVTADLKHADVYITVLGSKKEQQSTLQGLTSSSGFLRTLLAKRIKIKYLPELQFHFDPSIEKGLRIEKLIRNLHKDEDANG